jgi:hypothetical protein
MASAFSDSPPWHGHGLRIRETRLPRSPQNVFNMVVEPSGNGAFQVVSQLLASPELSSDVELGAMWSALPDLVVAPVPTRDIAVQATLMLSARACSRKADGQRLCLTEASVRLPRSANSL